MNVWRKRTQDALGGRGEEVSCSYNSNPQGAREAPDPWIEEILAIEHRIISGHKNKADITVTCDYEVMRRVETK